METLLENVKIVLRITTDAFDSEIGGLISACLADLGLAGIDLDVVGAEYLTNPLIVQAVNTYVKMYFGQVENDVFTRLKLSYDEQKAQLSMATGYTEWTGAKS